MKLIGLIGVLCAGQAFGQSLFHAPMPAQPLEQRPAEGTGNGEGGQSPGGPAAPSAGDNGYRLTDMSLLAVVPPKPRSYQKHDKVEIIVNQTSVQKYEQSLDTDKKYDLLDQLKYFPSVAKLLEDLTWEESIGAVTPRLGVNSDRKFKGEGTYERKDRFTTRISATVLDVKPNGYLVLEARETSAADEETRTMVISGICDPKDITTGNTVQSSQLANLDIKVEHTGQLKKTSTKGLIPRILEGIFNF